MKKTSLALAARAQEFTTPVLIMQGDADKIVSPEGNIQFFNNITSTDKTLLLMTGLYHELYNEPEKEMLLELSAKWFSERLNGPLEVNEHIIGVLEDGNYVLKKKE